AEDGIRDFHVTGVQTCALPISQLRPEGRNGPIVRTLAAYAEYYERWSQPWERQALLRARPVAGDVRLGERFVALIDPLRYPEGRSEERRVGKEGSTRGPPGHRT